MSDITGVAACILEAFLCLVLVFCYGLCESPLYSNSKSANPFFPFLSCVKGISITHNQESWLSTLATAMHLSLRRYSETQSNLVCP